MILTQFLFELQLVNNGTSDWHHNGTLFKRVQMIKGLQKYKMDYKYVTSSGHVFPNFDRIFAKISTLEKE